MSYVLEVNEPIISIEFKCKKHKQRLLIQAILKCSRLTLDGIASIIEVSPISLRNVYNGYYYLKAEEAVNLAQLFFICFND